MTKIEISRRKFIDASAAAGGGLMIGFYMSEAQCRGRAEQPGPMPTDRASRSTPG